MGRKAEVELIKYDEKLREVKIYLCHVVKRACEKNRWDQRTAAYYLGTSPNRIHLVDNLKVEQLTVNVLFRYLACADPAFQLLISLR